MLRRLGVPELIASDEADYRDIALRLGSDKPWREQMSRRIVAGHGRLFDDSEPMAALESFLLTSPKMHFTRSRD
jgi:predicted O-linked N-acetylglucosamine transferase (SPINDLY family)